MRRGIKSVLSSQQYRANFHVGVCLFFLCDLTVASEIEVTFCTAFLDVEVVSWGFDYLTTRSSRSCSVSFPFRSLTFLLWNNWRSFLVFGRWLLFGIYSGRKLPHVTHDDLHTTLYVLTLRRVRNPEPMQRIRLTQRLRPNICAQRLFKRSPRNAISHTVLLRTKL